MEIYKRILVAVDGSESSSAAFLKACGAAKRNGAHLGITTIIDTLYFANLTALDGGQTVNQFTENAEKMLEDYEKQAKDLGVESVETILDYGPPKATIVEIAAEKFHADLIVVGAVGTSRLSRILLGSVAGYVTLHAECDVLVERESLD
ncbi:universal stress family protein [Listeria fleischmannii 1991]|uniref:Universal stress protein n=2 Tax=Listeria fleischmannii TaxID=1069827 RepID=A0A2X3H8L6_9LIST|nr:universal stress protein [Listeria fleischmannii]EMG28265.1 nucleotide-binding protein, UspA family [Listeria fleischmannii subsp. fleischmannii LU2006-1]KMT60075.1 universal stress family protein [Listeria fleischmannii 1991]MBC1417930.1 universal stress protein [Listeria fleischmannii]SQC68741.1 Putative universal stress protein SAV1710 [Listeria fleischmannii subsp. fleischmannii]